jgi:hypothetical protein
MSYYYYYYYCCCCYVYDSLENAQWQCQKWQCQKWQCQKWQCQKWQWQWQWLQVAVAVAAVAVTLFPRVDFGAEPGEKELQRKVVRVLAVVFGLVGRVKLVCLFVPLAVSVVVQLTQFYCQWIARVKTHRMVPDSLPPGHCRTQQGPGEDIHIHCHTATATFFLNIHISLNKYPNTLKLPPKDSPSQTALILPPPRHCHSSPTHLGPGEDIFTSTATQPLPLFFKHPYLTQ